MAARCHFVFPIDAKNHKVLAIWDLNGYGEYEFDLCICDKVMACTSVGVRRRRRRRRRHQKHNTPEIFKFRGYNKSSPGDLLGFFLVYNFEQCFNTLEASHNKRRFASYPYARYRFKHSRKKKRLSSHSRV